MQPSERSISPAFDGVRSLGLFRPATPALGT